MLCQRSSTSEKVSSRFSVSRETGVSVSARALSAARSNSPARLCSRNFRGSFFAAPNVRDQQRQRRRCDAINTARVSDRARTMHLQFLFHLIRQSRQRRVVEIIGQLKTFIAPIRRDICRLTRKIDIILRVDLDLLGKFLVEFTKARPDVHEIGDRHIRIRQQLECCTTLSVFVQ